MNKETRKQGNKTTRDETTSEVEERKKKRCIQMSSTVVLSLDSRMDFAWSHVTLLGKHFTMTGTTQLSLRSITDVMLQE
jgi:hypothetical protein